MPGPLQAGFPGLSPGPVLSCEAPQPRVLAARDFGGEMHLAGPEGRAARRGPEFPKCPESFPWPRRHPAAAARGPTCPRATGRGAAQPEGRRRPPPAERLSAAPRPARAQRPPHSPGRSHRPAARGRETRDERERERPPPVAGPPARGVHLSRAPGAAGEGGREHARARGADGGRGGSRLGRVSHGARCGAARRGRRSLRSLCSLAFSLTFPSSVSEESGPCARVCMALCVSVCVCVLCVRARSRACEKGPGSFPTPDVTTMATAASTPLFPLPVPAPSAR